MTMLKRSVKNECEFRKFTLKDIGCKPEIFQNDEDKYAKLSLVDFYGVIYPEDNDTPYWFMIHSNPNNYRFSGVFKAGEGPFALQTPKHLTDYPQKDCQVEQYKLVDNKYFRIASIEPRSEIRIYENRASISIIDSLRLEGEYFPFAIIKHIDDTMDVAQITQSIVLTGLYDGKNVRGIGNVELCYIPEEENRNLNDFWSYVYAYDCGIRYDNKKEFSMIRFSLNGDSTGIYWLEGNDPVVSEHVDMDAVWQKLPYSNDNTCSYKDATWKFADKEIHFKGRWGHKGLTAYPRLELSGQSQVMGDWYEGSNPYKHKISMTFHENMDVYLNKLKLAGFKVLE